MKQPIKHVKTYIFRGLLASIPITLSVLVVYFLYDSIDKRVLNLIDDFIGFRIPGLGILLVLIILYIVGFIASNVVGKKIFSLIEKATDRIPLIRSTYKIGKQLESSFSISEKDIFKRAVLVEYLKPGIWTIGFVTGSAMDKTTGLKLLKVFVPTPPNPTSGTMVFVEESQTRNPGWTIEEAMKSVISGGIIGPNEID